MGDIKLPKHFILSINDISEHYVKEVEIAAYVNKVSLFTALHYHSRIVLF